MFNDGTKSAGEEKEGGDMKPQQHPYEEAIINTMCSNTKKVIGGWVTQTGPNPSKGEN